MDSLDLRVLARARDWLTAGHGVWLVTVRETWGSAPRPPGALLCLRADGLVEGSVSGGCVEDDLIHRVITGERPSSPIIVAYGLTRDEAARYRPAVRRESAAAAGAFARRGLDRRSPAQDVPP